MDKNNMANKLRNKADELAKLGRENLDVPIFYQDAGDMRCLAGLVENGEFFSALEYAENRDTEFRESIPSDIWNELIRKSI